MKKSRLIFLCCALALLAGCANDRAQPGSDRKFSADVAQRQVDAMYNLLNKQRRIPEAFLKACNTESTDTNYEAAVTSAWHAVGRHLNIQISRESLFDLSRREKPRFILLSSNTTLRVDESMFRRPYVTIEAPAFNPNEFFTVLRSVSVNDGYILDYLYSINGVSGFPVLYGRKVSAPPLPSAELLDFLTSTNSFPQDSYLPWQHIIRTDGGEQGYFELELLRILGSRFYLYWHSNYNDTMPVCSQEGLERLLSNNRNFRLSGFDKNYRVPAEFMEQARALDVRPVVLKGESRTSVSLTYFTNWGGFFKTHHTFSTDFPHKTIETDAPFGKNILFYDCGISY